MSELMNSYFAHREACLNGEFGKTVQFYTTYINFINYYYLLNRSIRTGDFEIFKYVLPKIANLFFVLNQPNYARWLVKYHDNLLKIGETHPEISEAMKKGYLGIQRTDKSFSRHPIDLTLEQTINAEAVKRLVGIINFTNSISARQRWCKSHEIRSSVISHTYEVTGLQKRQDVTNDLEKHNIKRDTKLLKNFISSFSKFMNPFDSSLDKNFLHNISNGKSASENVQKFLLAWRVLVTTCGKNLFQNVQNHQTDLKNQSNDRNCKEKATSAPRVDIIFDQYFSPSIKDYERTLRCEMNDLDFKITGPMQVRPVDFNKELKNIKFKQAFVTFLIDHWATQEMAPLIGETIINLSYDKCYTYKVESNVVIREENNDLSCDDHEEADTKIVHHVCKIDNDVATNILIKSCDTDVLVIMLGNMDHLECDSLSIYMEYGNNNKKRILNLSQLSIELGPKENEDYQNAFTNLGTAHITGCRNEEFLVSEKFVCEMYGFKNLADINTARFEKFCSTYKADNPDEPFEKRFKNYDASNLPPCKAELKQQLLRTQYITSIWRNAHLRFPSTLAPTRNGWDLQNGKLEFYWFEGDCMPPSVMDALKANEAQNTTISEDLEEVIAEPDIGETA
ncbi:Protein of unknown function [Cotesia congregata]|uniref:Uncharacterized protein n=1 Tax=Cotesia congregata TaxID=51543 RepID=A0A8J2MI37_COTCN|nr:Protein of unknown function [Cotesia congregata]